MVGGYLIIENKGVKDLKINEQNNYKAIVLN